MIKFQGHYIMYTARNRFMQEKEFWQKTTESLLTATA